MGGTVVTATATTPAGSTSEFSNNVLVPTSGCRQPAADGVVHAVLHRPGVQLRRRRVVRPDGTIASYAWDFGDTQTGSGGTVQPRLLAPGTYTVTLTVTDNLGATGHGERRGRRGRPPADAAFTGSCSGAACTFDASTSSDPDNAISSYTWDFGDTNTGNGVTAGHTYAAAGDYTVTLTVDDGVGGTSSSSQVFHADVATSSIVAGDAFTRTVVSGWGTADTGGA